MASRSQVIGGKCTTNVALTKLLNVGINGTKGTLKNKLQSMSVDVAANVT